MAHCMLATPLLPAALTLMPVSSVCRVTMCFGLGVGTGPVNRCLVHLCGWQGAMKLTSKCCAKSMASLKRNFKNLLTPSIWLNTTLTRAVPLLRALVSRLIGAANSPLLCRLSKSLWSGSTRTSKKKAMSPVALIRWFGVLKINLQPVTMTAKAAKASPPKNTP